MTPTQFCFWLAGILKMSKDDSPTDKLIREQLDEVIKREHGIKSGSGHPLPGINVRTLPLLTDDPTGGFVSDR